MRSSQVWRHSLRDTPADADAKSHQLLLRSGFIRQVASGIYSYQALGLRVLHKIEAIVREEMDRIGASEIRMPVVQPADLWKASGRFDLYGDLLLKMTDRRGRNMVFAPTAEEVMTNLAVGDIRSYKQLPLHAYQIQTKFRDEFRPRFGILRGREFIMKDAYSFDQTADDAITTYHKYHGAYTKILERIGVEFRAVSADSGEIGGDLSCEFHVLAERGEDDLVFDSDSYAANIEIACARTPEEASGCSESLEQFATPTAKTIEALVREHDVPIEHTIKTLVVAGSSPDTPLVALVVRGQDTLNEVLAAQVDQVASPVRYADPAAIEAALGAGPGSLGPVNCPIPLVVDPWVLAMEQVVAGANSDGQHYKNINFARDVQNYSVAPLRQVQAGDPSPANGEPLELAKGIEVGHIFYLGTKYSQVANFSIPGQDGKQLYPHMGCFGFGVTRTLAAIVEQYHDDKGMVWPSAIAPVQVQITPLEPVGSALFSAAEGIYNQLLDAGCEVLFDDRNERAGVKLKDAELVGIPYNLVLGERSFKKGTAELRHRQTGVQEEGVPLDGAAEYIQRLLDTAG